MLKLSLVEFFVRLIPEALIFILAAYTFSGTKINKKNYFLGTLLLVLVTIAIRFLPINYGVHTVMNIILMTVITWLINKIDIIKAIRASIMSTILLFTCEAASIVILMKVYGDRLSIIMSNSTTNMLCSLPSLVIFAIIVIYCNKYQRRKEKIENV